MHTSHLSENVFCHCNMSYKLKNCILAAFTENKDNIICG